MTDQTAKTADFGFRQVPLADKQALVDDVFHSGRAALRPDERPDVGRAAPGLEGRAGDGGQSAARATGASPCSMSPAAPATSPCGWSRRAAPATRATVRRHQRRHAGRSAASARERGRHDDIVSFIEGNAEALPFADRSFDAVTIAFGIRNVPRIDDGARRSASACCRSAAISLPGIFLGRCAGARRALRALFVQRHPGDRPRRHRRRRGLSLSGRIDPPLSAPGVSPR